MVEEVRATSNEKLESPVTEILEETKEVKTEEKQPVESNNTVDKKLPENIEKLVSFMEETGGNIEDYVRLNSDYSNATTEVLLKEYYKTSKPHLNDDEISFLIEDKFAYDEEVDEERDIKKKQLAAKEEIAKAKNFMEETKRKYYDEIKLIPGITPTQQKTTDSVKKYKTE